MTYSVLKKAFPIHYTMVARLIEPSNGQKMQELRGGGDRRSKNEPS